MKGLLSKDLYTIKNYAKTTAFLYVALLAMGIFMKNVSAGSLFTVFCTTYAMGLFSYDETSHFDRFVVATPLKRSQIVAARYLFTTGVILVALIANASISILTITANSMFGTDILLEIGLTSCLIIGISLFSVAIIFPLCYKFGSEKLRIFMVAVYGGVFGVVFATILIAQKSQAFTGNDSQLLIVGLAVVAISALAYLLSYFVSCKVAQGREY